MSAIYHRDRVNVDHDAITRRRALYEAISELQRATNALQAARGGSDTLRDAVLTDALTPAA